jgi:hypothetical protein
VPESPEKNVDAAVRAARSAFSSWRTTTPLEDRLLQAFDVPVRLRPAGADAPLLDAQPRERVDEAPCAKL